MESEKKKRKLQQLQKPSGKKYVTGGGLNDYFFECAPRWTVGDALKRLLTKVKNNPNATISIHKFVKDSCKGNLKEFFIAVRNSMNRGESVKMPEVAYMSFIQLIHGDKPLLRILPPSSKPRTRAAAVNGEGYAYKDYEVQVTKHGFELMNAKMVYGEVPAKKQKIHHTTQPMVQSGGSSSLLMSPGAVPMQNRQSQQSPVQQINLTEQEQQIANNMVLCLQSSVDCLLSNIHQLRVENEALAKENMTIKFINSALASECVTIKNQLQMIQASPVQVGMPSQQDREGSELECLQQEPHPLDLASTVKVEPDHQGPTPTTLGVDDSIPSTHIDNSSTAMMGSCVIDNIPTAYSYSESYTGSQHHFDEPQ